MQNASPEPCRENDIGKFEIIARDGAARIGKFHTKHGIISTPALLPVINPNIRTIEPREMWEDFGVECLITNSYIIKKSENLRDEAKRNGIHTLLNFPGMIMTDSGTFQSYVYGDVEVGPEEIIEFQKEIGVDVCTMLDVFGKPNLSYNESKEIVEETVSRSEVSIKAAQDMMINGPIQGGTFPDLRFLSAQKMSGFNFTIHPIGGIVPLMEKQKYLELIQIVSSCRHIIPASRPVHLFGCGHPHLFGISVAMGVDFFDSAAYALFAKDDRLIMPWGTEKLANIVEWPAASKTFFGLKPQEVKSLPKNERTKIIAKFNLEISLREMARVREAVRKGRIWEYVERKSAEHPAIEEAVNYLLEQSNNLDFMKWVEKSTKIQKNKGILWSKKIRTHPYVIAAMKEISNHVRLPSKDVHGNKVEENKWNLIIIHGVSGPWRLKCKELIYELYSRFERIQVLLQTPVGIIPYSLEDLNPFSQINGPKEIWDYEKNDLLINCNSVTTICGDWDKKSAIEKIRHSKIIKEHTKLVNISELEEYFDRNSVVAKTALFTKLNFQEAEKWLSNATFVKGGTGRIRNVFGQNGTHILSPRLEDGGLSLTIDGATKLLEFSKKKLCNISFIIVDDGAVPFVKKGRNVMHGFIISASIELRPGDSCLVLDKENNLLAHGISTCTYSEAMELKKGVAVKVKNGIDG